MESPSADSQESELTELYRSSKAFVADVNFLPSFSVPSTSATFDDAVAVGGDSYITVYNASPRTQRFYVISEPPTFTSKSKPSALFFPVYQNSSFVAAGTGMAEFLIPASRPTNTGPAVFVITGRSNVDLSQASLNNAPMPRPTDRKALTTYHDDNSFRASTCMVTMPKEFEPSFVQVQADSTLPTALTTNEVQITVDDSFNYPGEGFPFVGIGVPHLVKRNRLLPVCIWEAIPSTKFTLRPSTKWTCFRGELAAGRYGDLKPDTTIPRITVDLASMDITQEVKYDKNGQFAPYDGNSTL